jgi:shikimate kinase
MTPLDRDSVFLIGYRATGKTTVGEWLAKRLEFGFVDIDRLLTARLRMPISECFSRFGEDYFRDKESAVLQGAVGRIEKGEKLVVATGGGIILRPENVRRMRQAGAVVWLEASAATIRRRLASDPHTAPSRPGLTGPSAIDEVDALLQKRLPLYQQAADFSVSAEDGRSARDIAEEIFGRLDADNRSEL